MKQYHKIKTLWKRQSEKPHNMLVGEFAEPEFEFLKDAQWYFTEKVDGTNIRIMWDGNRVTFGGKTNNAQIHSVLYEKLQVIFLNEPVEQIFEEVFGETSACLYGEGFGAKIQKSGGNYKADGNDFALFDVLVGDWWLNRNDVEDIAAKFDLTIVPIVGTGTLEDMSEMVAKGFNSQWGDFLAEGIVAKPIIELYNRSGKRVITKLKHKDFQKINKK